MKHGDNFSSVLELSGYEKLTPELLILINTFPNCSFYDK
jgi:hypothetical protein